MRLIYIEYLALNERYLRWKKAFEDKKLKVDKVKQKPIVHTEKAMQKLVTKFLCAICEKMLKSILSNVENA